MSYIFCFCILLQSVKAHLTSLNSDGGVSPPKSSPLEEIDAEIPPEDKNVLYYLTILMFVTSTIISTLLTGSFLVASAFLWGRFKHMKFFWLLSVLTVSIFVLSILNLVINVPATLFSLLTKDFIKSDVFLFMSYIIDLCHYTILFSNLVIAVQRCFVFFFRNLADRVFETPLMYAWMLSIWVLSLLVVYAMMHNNCRYKYTIVDQHYILNCQLTTVVNLPPPRGIQTMELVLQFVLPCVILGIYIAITAKIMMMKKGSLKKNEITILKQAFFIFFIFQISASIPPGDKDGLYYFVISMFVVSTFTSTILTGTFLVLSIILWPHFKQMKFFWFLAQLTVSVFVMSSLNFLINVPATLFSLITVDFVQSEAFSLMSNVIDFCHNIVLFSNFMIA
ncbi:hypothetical protein CAEBREN_31943, partial [Caenorhabditis brenneri]